MRPKPFRRSTTNRRVAGICGPLAERLGLDPGLVRLGTLLLIVVTQGGAFLAYVAAAILIPEDDARPAHPRRRPARAARRTWPHSRVASLILVFVFLVVVRVSVGLWLLLILGLIGLIAWQIWSRGRRENPGPSELATALAAWQDRLTEVRNSADTRSETPGLPSSLSEALAIDPVTRGFIPGRQTGGPPEPELAPLRPTAEPAPASRYWRDGDSPAPVGGAPSGPVAERLPGAADVAPRDHAVRPAPAAVTPAPAPTDRAASPLAAPGDWSGESPALRLLGATEAQTKPLPITAFLPTAPAPHERPATAVAVLRRRPGATAMGWIVVLLLAGSVLGLAGLLGDGYWSDPLEVGATVSAVLGLGLVVSPWTGRPRWLAPTAGALLAGGAGTLLVLYLFHAV